MCAQNQGAFRELKVLHGNQKRSKNKEYLESFLEFDSFQNKHVAVLFIWKAFIIFRLAQTVFCLNNQLLGNEG